MVSQRVHNDNITHKHQAKIRKKHITMTKPSSSLRLIKRVIALGAVVGIAVAVYVFSSYTPDFTAQPVSKDIAHDTLLP